MPLTIIDSPRHRPRRYGNLDHAVDNAFSPADVGPVQWLFPPDMELSITGTTILDGMGDQVREIHRGQAYSGDGAAGITVPGLLTSFTIQAVCGTPVCTASGILDIANGDIVCGISISGADGSLFGFYKCDEGTGTTCYDGSGNENHGTITGMPGEGFHTTQDYISYRNDEGYNTGTTTGGNTVYIPRDESDTEKDVLGNYLSFSGRVKYEASLSTSHCATLHTTDITIEMANAIPSGSTLTNRGMAGVVLTTSSKTISVTGVGTFYDAAIRDPSGNTLAHLPCAEGGGLILYDDSGNENHGTVYGANEVAFWTFTAQTEYHKNLAEGFTLYTGSGMRDLYRPYHEYKYPLGTTIPSGYTFAGEHPSGPWHNAAETGFYQKTSPELIQANLADGNDYWFTNSSVNIKSYVDITGNVGNNDRIMADVHQYNRRCNIVTVDSGLTADDLFDLRVYLWQAP